VTTGVFDRHKRSLLLKGVAAVVALALFYR
jgi:hypothetical protein